MMARIRAASTPSRRPVTNPLVKAATSIRAHSTCAQGAMTLAFKVACHAESIRAAHEGQVPGSGRPRAGRSVAAADLEPGQAPAGEHEAADDHDEEDGDADVERELGVAKVDAHP